MPKKKIDTLRINEGHRSGFPTDRCGSSFRWRVRSMAGPRRSAFLGPQGQECGTAGAARDRRPWEGCTRSPWWQCCDAPGRLEYQPIVCPPCAMPRPPYGALCERARVTQPPGGSPGRQWTQSVFLMNEVETDCVCWSRRAGMR